MLDFPMFTTEDGLILGEPYGPGTLELSLPGRRERSHLSAQFRAILRIKGLQASILVSQRGFDTLAALFDEIASETWASWDGVKQWESSKCEIKLAAGTDQLGHITVKVFLRGLAEDTGGSRGRS